MPSSNSKPVPSKESKAVAVWLFVCCFMVALMVIVGGLTRLTESGLSITEWKPVSGILPPLGDHAWQEEFARYQQSPEFAKKNFDITVEQFKGIYWLEFIHRLLGRIIGIVFLLPLLWFAVKGRIRGTTALALGGIFCLGGLQGVIGWYMVKSGLVDDPRVSPYRLALHLGMAFLIFAALWWMALSHWYRRAAQKKTSADTRSLYRLSSGLTSLIFLQVIAGAFVAGLDAGLTYNSFPLMDGKWIPDGLWLHQPLWVNFTENITMVQFVHRVLAFVVLAAVMFFWLKAREIGRDTQIKRLAAGLVLAVMVQAFLGISTLLLVVPAPLASLHQAVALIIFAYSLFINWKLYARLPADHRKGSKKGSKGNART